MDMTASIAPRSDQVNADDLVAGPVVYTIREVVKGKAEQPFDFLFEETDRAFRPGVTMRRLIVAAWGADTKVYVGRRLKLYRDPTIKFGKDVVGGIRISHMSHLDKPVTDRFQVTRGKREVFTVQPLPANETPTVEPTQPEPTAEEVAACVDRDELTAMWRRSGKEMRATIEARVADLDNEPGEAGQ